MKEHILAALREQFDRWEELLAGLSEQQISIARIEGGLQNREPEFPPWVIELNSVWEDNADQTNARIYEINHEKPWAEIHQNWRDGFLRFLELGDAISEKDLLDGDRYLWLKGYSLAFILVASYEHHQEHFEKLVSWLGEQGK